MENKLPAFLFYANDFLGSTAEMELESVGAYIKLLAYQWINGGIPKEKAKIAKLLSCDGVGIARLWQEIGSKFILVDDRLVNKRLEMVRQEAIEYRKTASEHGKRGAEARWGGHSPSIAQAMPNGMPKNGLSSSSSLSSSISIKKENNTTPQAIFMDSWKKLYEHETKEVFKPSSKDFIIASKLIKDYSLEVVVDKSKLLFDMCKNKSVWFTKGGMSDFNVGKLSSMWNSIIKEAKENGKRIGINKESFLQR